MKSEKDQLQQAISLLQGNKLKANSLLRDFVDCSPNSWEGFFYLAASESILQNY